MSGGCIWTYVQRTNVAERIGLEINAEKTKLMELLNGAGH